uniref:Uncharacterized protein n=1 Tax=Glossina austeni TaxID=7395 RepID=A0A1A9V5S3_GLOAU
MRSSPTNTYLIICLQRLGSLINDDQEGGNRLFIQLHFTPMFFVLQLLNAVVVTQTLQIVFQNLITQSIGSFKSFETK